jgi:glycosyltransferase involved in cell wall biosynthesis
VDRLGLADVVKFRGWLSQGELRDRLDACRFTVLPSLSEGLPVAIMESFARARPVIATDIAGVTELVEHQRNGIVVPAGDATRLAAAIEALLEAPEAELHRMGMRGRERVVDECDSDRNARELARALD